MEERRALKGRKSGCVALSGLMILIDDPSPDPRRVVTGLRYFAPKGRAEVVNEID